MIRSLLVGMALLVPTLSANADERLKGIACRSVHLGYSAPAGTAFYCEATVEQSADGTYFCACGFNKGYFGIQELANGKKLAIFSVWDPGSTNDPKSVAKEKRVKLLYQGEGVRVGRFGGEGTGGQSFFDLEWKAGITYRFLVTSEADGTDRTAFTGYIYLPEKKEWKKLVTFSTLTKSNLLSGYYSFVEDFRRNKISTTKVRKAIYGNVWVRTEKGEWVSATETRFTADSNPVLNIDAGPIVAGPIVDHNRFFLATGGDTKNATTKLREVMHATGTPAKPPADLPVK